MTGKRTETKKYRRLAMLFIMALVFAWGLVPPRSYAADSGIPGDYEPISHGIPHARFRNVFETETVRISGIRVIELRKGTGEVPVETDPQNTIHFRIFNTTTKETEFGGTLETITGEDGHCCLPDLDLKKGHDYIFFVEDANYRYPRGESYPSASKVYVQICAGDEAQASQGPGAYNYMTTDSKYSKVEAIYVERRDSECADPFDENRLDTADIEPIKVCYKGNARAGVKFRLVSDTETIEAVSGSGGVLKARLIEGVTYMVYLDSHADTYSIDPFPIVAIDKTEYGEGLCCYNHSTCARVGNIALYDKGDTVFDGLSRRTAVTSLKKRSVVTGMNFKNLLIIDRVLDDTIDKLKGKKYEVISISAVNQTRWEISKLTGTDFGITWKKTAGRLVTHVYYIKGGSLKEIGFRQTSANEVCFTMDSLSLYPVVIEYDSSRTYADKVAQEEAAAAEVKAKKVKTVTVNSATVNAKVIDRAVKKAGGSNRYVTKIILGSRVKKIGAKAFAKYGRITVLEVRTKKLAKKNVKNSLRGSKVRTIKVKVAKKAKTNKSYVKKYRKIFTKKNAGRKVTVK